MSDILFRQTDKKDPYAFYRDMREHNPLYYDGVNDLWGIYTYEDCYTILAHSGASIHQGSSFLDGLNGEACSIANHLARLSNVPRHCERRDAALQLFSRWQATDVEQLMRYLLGEPRHSVTVDWVQQIGCRLPAFALLKGVGFSTTTAESIVYALPDLINIMHPVKSEAEARAANRAAEIISAPLHDYVVNTIRIEDRNQVEMYRSNLAGLLIQSFDAGRGLLSNALLWALRNPADYSAQHRRDAFVREVLRMDPPIQNTRREITEDISVGNVVLKRGARVLIVLASANRDPKRFHDAAVFDASKLRDVHYLTFGVGIHQCIAEHFSINTTTSALQFMYTHYSHIELKEHEIRYEPKINVRLPARMVIELSRES